MIATFQNVIFWAAMRIGFEVSFWEKVYQRKDQEPTRYAAYLSAEENLSKTFVSKTPAKTLSSFVYFANDLCS
jgi:hypothetical protein